MEGAEERQVLPRNVKPLHYDLTFEPEFESFTFTGTSTITVKVLEDTTFISLNTKELELKSTKIEVDGTALASAFELTYDADNETTTIQLGQTTLQAGKTIKLTQNFAGKLNSSMTGFYRASWTDKDGIKHWLAATQMAPVDTRRVFPCFDEPALKATFSVTLIADHALTCLSNMDIASQTEMNSQNTKRKAVTFNKTPLMSTYLVAFIIGDLQVFESHNFRLPVRVYCTPDQDIRHGVYAAELASRTLDFYEQEFGIPYPLPKMDMVAVPDFPMRGMENWGLTTYRVECLLVDEEKSSAFNKQGVTENVQHELSHQWFGNLVTMDFWDGLWLNEGFARWMSCYARNHFFPDWKVWDEYVTSILRDALSMDGLRSSHPVEVPVKRAEQINEIFDEISYDKGCAVLRMISKHLGEDVFMKGVRGYLQKHAYDSTGTNDLWVALSEASGKDVEKIAGIWTKDVGYPVISVTEDEQNGQIHVKQNRFLGTGDIKPEEDNTLYPVILGLRSKRGVEDSMMLNTREGTFPVEDWDVFKLNAEHSGFYRTLYSSKRLEILGDNAKEGHLPISDRAGLISDVRALAQAGYQKTSDLLSLLQSFDSDPAYEVWSEISMCLRSLDGLCMFEDERLASALKAFQRSIVSTRAHQLGWTFAVTDGEIEQRFKALLFRAACRAGDETAKLAACEMFARFQDGDRNAIHANLRPTVYSTVLRDGGQAEYDVIIKEYETAITADEKEDALASLGAARNPELLTQALDYALSGQVKAQDIYELAGSFTTHNVGALALWAWMRDNWDVIFGIGGEVAGFGMLVRMTVAPFTQDNQRQMVQDFFETQDTRSFGMELAKGIDLIRAKQGWLARDRSDIEEWLSTHGYLT